MADFQYFKSHSDSQNLFYYSSFPKSKNPIKAVIRHLQHNTPGEDIADGLVSLGFDVVRVKQMAATRRSPPEESKIINLHLFLVTMPRSAKTQEIFRLLSLCHIAITVEVYRARMLLARATNASSSATSGQIASILPAACGAEAVTCTRTAQRRETLLPHQHAVYCRLAEGDKAQPANYRGCRHAKEQLQKRESQRTPKTTTARLFSSNLTTPTLTFATALRGSTQQQQRLGAL
jgi:hypothetical protein